MNRPPPRPTLSPTRPPPNPKPNPPPPADRRRQEHAAPELLEEAGLRRGEARQRSAEGEAGDRRPELHLALARAPDRAGAAAACQRHPDTEREAPRERARADRKSVV